MIETMLMRRPGVPRSVSVSLGRRFRQAEPGEAPVPHRSPPEASQPLARQQSRWPLEGCGTRIQQPHGWQTYSPRVGHYHGNSVARGEPVMMESGELINSGVRM